jgi:branched-chain amino acid transport system substrate-binding protein
MKKFGLLVLKLILFYLLLQPAHASDPIKIGLTLGLTGKYAEMSDMQMKGFRLWETDINSRGGILGRKVKLFIYDDKSEPLTARSLYERLILKDKVDLVLGPYSSEITESILPVTEQYGYPVLITGASADSLWQKGYKYAFGVYTSASRYAVGFLEFLVKKDLTDIAIVHADDAFSKSIADGTKKWAERFGLNVVLYEGFKKGAKNLDDIAIKAKASKAQVLIVCGHFDESVNMRLALKNIGWHPMVYYASVGPALQKFYDKLKEDAEDVFSSSQWEPQSPFPKSKDFYNKFKKAYKEEPSYHAGVAYAGGQILEDVIKKARGIDREKIREILSAADTMSVIGRYGVDRTGMQIRHFNIIIQWQKGKKEIVWPDEIRTAKPIFK